MNDDFNSEKIYEKSASKISTDLPYFVSYLKNNKLSS